MIMRFSSGLGLLAALGVGGCASTGPSVDPAIVSYGQLGPAWAAEAPATEVFYLGAGDALGQELFTTYVASIRQAERESYYANVDLDHGHR